MNFNGYLRMSEKEERRQEYQLSITTEAHGL